MDAFAKLAMRALQSSRALVRLTGPYLLLEVLMPGGTLLAAGLFLYRRWRRREAGTAAIGLG